MGDSERKFVLVESEDEDGEDAISSHPQQHKSAASSSPIVLPSKQPAPGRYFAEAKSSSISNNSVGPSPQKRPIAGPSSEQDENKRPNPPPAKKCVYDMLDSSSDGEEVAQSKKFKSPLADKASAPAELGVSEVRKSIIEAFDFCYSIPVSSLNKAMCQKHGISIDYRTAPCRIPNHKHGSLSKYLQCFNDIVEIKSHKTAYILLADRNRIVRRRKLAYTQSRNDSTFNACCEALLTTLFPIRTTLPMEDLQFVFKLVYGSTLEDILGASLKKFLNRSKTPNVRLTGNDPTEYSVIIIPLRDPSYQEWTTASVHERIHREEAAITGEAGAGPADTILSINVASMEVFKNIPKIQELQDTLAIADLNIPKFVLNSRPSASLQEFIHSPVWRYACQNNNFDDGPTFFIGATASE